MRKKILLVDDNVNLVDSLSMILELQGYEVSKAYNGLEAINKMKTIDFIIIIMDIKMPEMNGVEAYIQMKRINPLINVILMTAYTQESIIQNAYQEGVKTVIFKPVTISEFLRKIEEATN